MQIRFLSSTMVKSLKEEGEISVIGPMLFCLCYIFHVYLDPSQAGLTVFQLHLRLFDFICFCGYNMGLVFSHAWK